MVAAGTVVWAQLVADAGISPRRGALPPADPAWVARPALLEVMNQALRRRLTTVVAGPGCGKTTLLVSWAHTAPCAWYTLGPADAAVPALVHGLIEALRVRLPGLQAATAAWFGIPAGPELDGRCPGGRDLADVFASALAEAAGRERGADLALIIDDVQDLPPDGPSVRLLELLCQQAPQTLHLVLSSRVRLPFPVQRLRGRGQVLELDAAMLAFSAAESENLLATVFGGRFVSGELHPLAEQVHDLTGGWPAATRLAAEWLRHRGPPERGDPLDVLRRPGGPLFDYLAEEVLEGSGATLQALLTQVAPLPRFTVELCQALGVDVDELELTRLAGDAMVVRRHCDRPDWFTLGPLIRDVALARMHPDACSRVRRQAMDWFTDHGHLAEALGCAVALDEPPRIAEFLVDHGEALLAQGSVAEILACSSGLPALLRSATVERLEGAARLVHGDWRGAAQCFRRAAGHGTAPAPELAWRLSWSHYVRGEFDEAVAIVDQTRPGDEKSSAEALLLSWAASASWRRGDHDRSHSLAQRAVAVATASGDDHALAAAHTAMLLVSNAGGDRAGVAAHATMGLAAAQRAGDVLRMISIRVHRAGDHIERGSCLQALRELEIAIGHADSVGYLPELAFALYIRGRAQLGLGRLDGAIADFEVSRTAYQRMDSRDAVLPLLGVADAYRERGDLALARHAYTEAVQRAERLGDDRGLVPALAGLARVLVGDDPGHATALAARSVERGQGSARVIALLAAGWVALECGAPEQADRSALSALDLAGARSDRAGLAEALELRAAASPDPAVTLRSLREAARVWAELGNPLACARNAVALARSAGASEPEVAEAEQRLRALGVREPSAPAAGLLSAVPAPARAPVLVRTLGGFGIFRDGRPVRATEWNSKKARDLLKLLISRHGRPTPREVLIETLWPAADPACCANRLSVALSTIRTVLDPDHQYPPDHFVHSDKHVVSLANLRVDVEEFLVAAGRLTGRSLNVQAVDELRATEALYTGDFLEEDPYQDWAVSMREQASAAYLTVATALAGAAGASGDYDLAVRCYLRVLERDHYDEQAHLRLTSVLTAAGRHGQARARYLSYTHRMAELGIEAAPFPVPSRRRTEGRSLWPPARLPLLGGGQPGGVAPPVAAGRSTGWGDYTGCSPLQSPVGAGGHATDPGGGGTGSATRV
ncbi:MAG: BTAD domain-containing putative transcriptional regulator [Pseudonocardiales bacterium]